LAFTPYVGAVIGMFFVDYRTRGDFTLGEFTVDQTNSDDRTNFAWNIGAGVAYAITQNLDVDFNYVTSMPVRAEST
jgi:opacity protein-like surface antigen